VALQLPVRMTAADARATLDMLVQNLRTGSATEPVTVDAGALAEFDSTALAVLLELRRQAAGWGRSFQVVRLPSALHTLARVYGVASLLGLQDSASGEGSPRPAALKTSAA